VPCGHVEQEKFVAMVLKVPEPQLMSHCDEPENEDVPSVQETQSLLSAVRELQNMDDTRMS